MGKKLLLADDSVTIQKVVGISFANEDIELVTVDNGDDAVARAREECPDVVLADVVMPGMNGYEVCEALKNDPALAHVPVLLLTGTFEAFDSERADRCGAAGHIAKPFEAQTLVDRVRELMKSAAATPAEPVMVGADDGATVAIGRLGMDPSSTPVESADSFDFFEEALGDAPAPDTAATHLELDSDDSTFSFADATPASEAAMPETAMPEAPATPVPGIGVDDPLAGTQVISEEPPPAAPAEPDIAFGLDTATAASADTLARLVTGEPEPSDIFDLATGADDPLAGENLGQETVLDPQGASGYDVSGTDLAEAEDAGPAASDDLLWGQASGAMPPVGSAAPDPSEARPLAEMPEVVTEGESGDTLDEPAVAALMDESSLENLSFAEAAPDFAIGEEAPAVAAERDDGLADFSDLSPVPQDEPPRVSADHDPAAIAGIALAEIEPQLREQLHDTLEKIAWENLGSVTEQIISQAIERIERAAWEVIPEMAETLIREEIRRMKGE